MHLSTWTECLSWVECSEFTKAAVAQSVNLQRAKSEKQIKELFACVERARDASRGIPHLAPAVGLPREECAMKILT